ncbi:MAG: PorV/PorQ family protein [Ignavibacteria bacterium]|nr:PorV/PorQ family protein [Ignavibacteria bacterium]
MVVNLVALVACLLINPIMLFAGRGDKAGTAAASELLIPVGARSIALAGSSLATISGVEAIYWNPAGLARSSAKTNLLLSHMSYLADIGVDYIAAGSSLSDVGRIGLTIKTLSFGDVKVTTEDQPDGTGEKTSPTFMIIGGTFARQISDRIAVGITMNFVFERMARVSATDIAFNAGVQYSGLGGLEGLSVGVAVKNIGPSMRFGGGGLIRTAQVNDANRQTSSVRIQAAAADLPSTIEIGLGYTVSVAGEGRMNFASTFQNNNFSDDEYKIGAEYIFNEVLFVRGGAAFSSEDEGREYIFGPTAGVGISATIRDAEVSVDYAYRSVKYFTGNHVFTIAMGF